MSLSLLAVPIALALSPAVTPMDPVLVTFDSCQVESLAPPFSRQQLECPIRAALATGDWGRAEQQLRLIGSRFPEQPLIQAALGRVLVERHDPAAEQRLQAAAAQFELGPASWDSLLVQHRLVLWFLIRGELDRAQTRLAAAATIAEQIGEPAARALVNVATAKLSTRRGRWAEAWLAIEPLEATAMLHPDLQTAWLDVAGASLWGVGRTADSLRYYTRQLAVQEQSGDRYNRPSTLYNILLLRSEVEELGQPELRALLESGLRSAQQVHNRGAEVSFRLGLAQNVLLTRAERRDQAVQALRMAGELKRETDRCFALRLMSQLEREGRGTSASRAISWARAGVECAEALSDPFHIARSHLVLTQRLWDAGQRVEGLAHASKALDKIERVRDLQPDSEARAGTFDRWVFFYDRTIGMLLDSPAPSFADLDAAFAVAERRRARTLLDLADRAGVTELLSNRLPETVERERLLVAAQAARLQLASDGWDPGSRESLRQRLERSEQTAESLSRRAGARSASFARLRLPETPSLSELMARLEANEAMLAYLDSGDFGYGSKPRIWVVTRDRVELLSPEQMPRPDQIQSLLGLVSRRDGSEQEACRALFDMLLKQPLAVLPASIDRLVIVPDGPLATIPWSMLQAAPGVALIQRFSVSLAPSASLWFGWRSAPVVAEPGVLAISDPLVNHRDSRAVLRRLPYSRLEAIEITREFGWQSRVLSGSAATEQGLRRALGASIGVVHFAAHAMVDELSPERAAIALTPLANDDGWLEARELLDFNFDQRAIVLSACSGAQGKPLLGEGPMSLVRAFLLGGARAVVAANLSLRDDDARAFVGEFYRSLRLGARADEALARAQRQRLAGGAPGAAWAPFGLHGDGSWRVQPVANHSLPGAPDRAWVLALSMFLGVSVLVYGLSLERKVRVN
jgi:CHAT domain-containing protein